MKRRRASDQTTPDSTNQRIPMQILLIEDDETVSDAIVQMMSLNGFQVTQAANTQDAYTAFQNCHFILAIVDIGLPGADGMTFVRRIRKDGSRMPVLTLTARHALREKLNAFELGVDDYLVKPFDMAELLVRCRALLRRANEPSGVINKSGRINIDLAGRQVKIDEAIIDFTRSEWLILELLTRNFGKIVSKERLLRVLAGQDNETTANAVETHISRLRTKLGSALRIRVVRGLGYRLDEDAP